MMKKNSGTTSPLRKRIQKSSWKACGAKRTKCLMLISPKSHSTKRSSVRSHIRPRNSKTAPNFLALYFGAGEHTFISRIFGVSCRSLFSPSHASYLPKKSFSRYPTASLMSSKFKDFCIGRKSNNHKYQ